MAAATRVRLAVRAAVGLVSLTVFSSAMAVRQPLMVAVATNFRHTFERLEPELEQQDLDITAIYASSGTLMQQIMHGAPFTVFLSADSRRPEALEAAGLVRAGSRHTYAVGKLALWSRKTDVVPNELLRQGVRVALANPELAPYGRAAMETLVALSLWQGRLPEKVYGRNIAQTFVFARTGHAELAFVAVAQLHHQQRMGGATGSVWRVPAHYHQPIKQQLVIIAAPASGVREAGLNDANASYATSGAEQMVARLLSAEGQAIIQSFGYEVVNLD